ncbi:MAG: THUMP domain-containing protein [Candidatus Thermoplasmatota archaeon]
MTLFLLRYGEVGLKSPRVRRRFEQTLVANIHERCLMEGVECLTRTERGRIFVSMDDLEDAKKIFSHTFGIVSFSPAVELSADLRSLEEKAVELFEPLMREGVGFAVRATRTGQHPFTSMDVARALGTALLSAYRGRGVHVDLTQPDLELFVEVRQNLAYFYTEVFKGPGGLPLGTQGRVLALVEDERDAAAAWLLAKRGCTPVCAEREEGAAELLRPWIPGLRRLPWPENPWALARKLRAHGIVVGWDMRRALEAPLKGQISVFYPLVGLGEGAVDEIIARMLAPCI